MSGSREIPALIDGFGPVESYWAKRSKQDGAGAPALRSLPKRTRFHRPGEPKVVSLEEAIRRSGLSDGGTVSFHHHLRDGDGVINLVMSTLGRMGLRNIHMAPSSLNDVNDELIPLIKQGVISGITTSGARGELGRAISQGILPSAAPAVFRSHGGRARATEEGSISIDVAFIAAPACDRMGNISGTSGRSACGSLGYAIVDAQYAACVVAVTDGPIEDVLPSFSIPGSSVDYIVPVESIGDPIKISSGATRISRSPVDLAIAARVASLIRSSPVYRPGFSMQFGTGGASLAVARYLSEYMRRDGVNASFILGGITSQSVRMLEEGLCTSIFDVQCFDLVAAQSLAANPRHREVSASHYASPNTAGALVNFLDVVVLSAMEVDTDFNVNVLTGSDGFIRGASGGHSDTARGARLTIVAGPAMRGRLPLVVDRVKTVITPGNDVACVVTDQGVAWNPAFSRLAPPAIDGRNIIDIEALKKRIEAFTGVPDSIPVSDRITGVVEYPDGSVIDVIRAPSR